MSNVEGTTRICVEVPQEINDKLKRFLPWGTKAEVIRALIDMLISAQESNNEYIAHDLLRGRCKLVQILNNKEDV